MKRILSFVLSLAMVISMLPVGAFAAAEDETIAEVQEETGAPVGTAEAEQETPVSISQTILPDVWLPENEELYQIYVEQQLYGSNSVSFLGMSAREQLSTIGGSFYDFLKGNIQNIASGNCASTTIELSSEDLAAWGASTEFEAESLDEAYSALLEQLEETAVLSALLHDCPYDLYWYDKSTGVITSGTWYYGYGKYIVDKIVISFAVAGNYQAAGYNPNAPMVDTSAASRVTAAARAQSVVDSYAACSDYEKLIAYKNEICSLVSYDTAAASSGTFAANNDPWGLVNVFDGDSATNVVCEGYAKAFQYLCDLSAFSGDTACYSVSGYMSGGTGAGPHMWNIVTMGGQNYLVDVTNSDAGTVGHNGSLFLAGTTGSVTGSYTISGVTYTYNSDTLSLWGTGENSILKLAKENYDPSAGDPCAAGHTVVTDAAVAATCTENGLTEGKHCSVCGAVLAAQEIVNATGHTYGAWERMKEPACTEAGSEKRSCACGAEETRAVDALGHTSESVPAVDATCTENGLTEGSRCSVCGAVLAEQEEIPAAGHAFGEWTKTKAATCTEEGEDSRTCSVCGTVETRSTVILGHTVETDKAVAATCTENGLTEGSHCADCGEVLSAQEIIKATGHSFENGVCTSCGEAEPLVYSGTCGENLTWSFDQDSGTLTISGSGAMEDYTEGTAPWYSLSGDIRSITVEDGVTYIGDYAFSGMGSSYTVTIPASVTALGSRIFLQELECIEVTFLGNAPKIKADTFTDIRTYISYPYSDPTWNQAFKDSCGGKIIWRPFDDQGQYKDMGGCGQDLTWKLDQEGTLTLEGFGDMELFFAASSPWEEYFETVNRIVLPEGLTSVRELGFYGLKLVTQINIPAAVTRIGRYAFGGCTGLETITFCGDAPQIAEYAFEGVTAIAYYPAGNATWTEQVKQQYGGTITWIPVEEPLKWSFDEATGTLTITGEGRMDNYTVDSPAPWNGFAGEIRAIRLEGGITAIGSRAFVDCTGLKTVSIPDSVTDIGKEAFFCCTALTTLNLGNGVETVGENAFASCTDLTTVSFPASAGFGKNAFLGDLLIHSVVVTPGTGVMADYDFNSSRELPWNQAKGGVAVTIQDGVTNIGSYAFYDSNVTSVSIAPSVESIGTCAFANCDSLTSITIPYGVETIGNSAFFGIHNVTSIELPNSVREIGEYAFAGSQYQSVTLPYGIAEISKGMFESCGSLTTVSIPSTVKTIGANAFAYCRSLKGVVIPEGVTTLENDCFAECSIYSLSLPQTLTDIGSRAFAQNQNLITVTIPSGVRTIREYAFYECDYLSLLIVESLDLTVESNAFKNCAYLNDIGFIGTSSQWKNGVKLESGCGIENARVEYNTTYQPLTGVKILNEWGTDVSGTTGVMDLSRDNTIVLSAEPLPKDYAYSYFVEWGADSDIVSGEIDDYGNLKLKGLKPGTVTITAIIYEVFGEEISGIAVADYTLQIKRLVNSIEISGGYDGYIATGVPTALTAAVKPKNAENTTVTWNVENVTGEAVIDSDGVITGTVPGTVYVWAMATDGSGAGDLLELTVADYGVEITGATEVMGGKSITLKAQLLPYNMTKTSIVWSLADPADKAYVTLSNGKLTAKKVTEQHKVTILASAKDGSAQAGSITVTVVPAVTGVVIERNGETVNGSTVSYDLNDPSLTGMTFSASTLPLDAGDGINWTVSDSKGAYADYAINGNEISVTNPRKTGTVTLTAKATDGSGKTAVIKVSFAKLAQSVTITNAPEKLRGGAKVTLKNDIASDKTLTDKGVVWSVSDASVPYASISSSGVLTTKSVCEQVTIQVVAQVKANPDKTDVKEITLYPGAEQAQIWNGNVLTAKNETIYVDLADPTMNLTGSILPASAIQEGNWSTSSSKVATVEGGVVTVHKAGTATITFKAADNSNKSTTVKISAGKWVDSIDVYTCKKLRMSAV